ncbi:hypothetical protein Glove_117g599 [Diversispora epigaea]|uniref:NYN domain-containing protein n=1 Tax=Diversispora epigaea TaxID=1348612 RepID=A0A397J3A9_9GLOM|nr:hypothetical protein Glove_117g599 [Diversispora epigaea]
MSSESSLPSSVSSDEEMANVIKNYGTKELIEYLRKKNLGLDVEDFAIFHKEKITGLAFLGLNDEKFRSIGFALGLATILANIITDLKSNIPKPNTGLVSVFVDNSNVLIEGKYTVGDIEETGEYDRQRGSYYISQLHLDHGRLLRTVLNGRKMGSDPVIVGSRPPRDDAIWDQAKKDGFMVIVYDRNFLNKENIDTTLVLNASKVIYLKDPGTLVLIAGDGDYESMISEAIRLKWKVEIWFWSKGMSVNLLKKDSTCYLDNYYKHFTFAVGPNLEKKTVLQVTDGEMIKKWKDKQVMDCYVSLGLFGWWNWDEDEDGNDILYMFFDDKTHSADAKKWLEGKYSDNIKVWEVQERKRKNSLKK